MRASLTIREVGPREGLQSDPQVVDTATKVKIIQTLAAAGLKHINAVALVSPRVMPQMADAERVLEAIGVKRTFRCSALVPNEVGLSRAGGLAERGLLDEVFLVHAVSEAILRANGISGTVDEHLGTVIEMADRAKGYGLGVGVFISGAFGCSIEGRISEDLVLRTAESLLNCAAVDDVVVSDSTGQADPVQVEVMLERLARAAGSHPLTLHIHNSRGAGSANVAAAVSSSVQNLTIDTGFGGLGGDVPFLPEAAGNVATEDICEMLGGMGIQTGVDVELVVEASRILNGATGRNMQSGVYQAGVVRWKHDG